MKSALQCLREFRSFAFWIYFLVAPSLEHWRADFTLWFQFRFWESDINFFLRVEEIVVFPHKLSSSIFRFLQQRYSSVVPGQGGFEKRMGWFWHCLFADMGSTIHPCQTQFMGGGWIQQSPPSSKSTEADLTPLLHTSGLISFAWLLITETRTGVITADTLPFWIPWGVAVCVCWSKWLQRSVSRFSALGGFSIRRTPSHVCFGSCLGFKVGFWVTCVIFQTVSAAATFPL